MRTWCRISLVVSLCAVAGASACPARADRGFAPRFVSDADGAIALAANTLETCPTAALGCGAARDGEGTLLDDNDFAMEYVDVDGDAATFDSSSSRLTLPAGARVLFAGLYVGARTEAGVRGSRPRDGSPDALRSVLLQAPGQDGYTRIGPGDTTLDLSSGVRGAYQAFDDVTDLVRRAGAGVYTVADVQAATGVDRYAGWALLVAYAAPGDPPRNLSIFDGLQSVTRGQAPVTLPLSGFTTPLDGPVRTQVGVVAYEGDLGSGGDGIALDGHPLSDAVNSATNFFDSGISVDGVPTNTKTPDYRNQLGFDAKLVQAGESLPNAATGASLRLSTSLEQYLPGAVAFATDLYAPDLQVTKTVDNLTAPGEMARPGDRLRYAITYRNSGQAAAQDVIAADQLPDGVALLPGSLRVTDLDGPQPLTDPPGDDTGEYDPTTRTVRVFLGQAATPAQGGAMPPAPAAGDQATISFEVEVDPTAGPGLLSNSGSATATAASIDHPLEVVSNPATIEVRPAREPVPVADLSTSEQQSEAQSDDVRQVTDAITVTDHGPADATDVHTEIDVAPGEIVELPPTPGATCTSVGGRIICVIAHLDAGASTQIDLIERSAAGEGTVAPTEVSAVADQVDEDPGNNAAITPTVSAPPPLAADEDSTLTTSIRPISRTGVVAGRVEESITVRNRGPGDADHLTIAATPSLPVTFLRASGRGLRCAAHLVVRCSAARLRAGAAVRVRLSAEPRRAGTLTFTADASSDHLDLDPVHQSARSRIVVRERLPALAVDLTAGPDVIVAGRSATVEVLLANRLSTPIDGATVCVHVPVPLRIADAAAARATRRTRCWTVDQLSADSTRRLRLRVTAPVSAAPGRVTLTAIGRAGAAVPTRRAVGLTIHPAFLGCQAPHWPTPSARPDC